MIHSELEKQACTPTSLDPEGFNPNASIPHGVTIDHFQRGMNDFLEFLGFINTQLNTKEMPRLEAFLMPANFSSMVGEYMTAMIPKYCSTIVKNNYHNGHPDMLPEGAFPNNSILHASEGIEVKASRYTRGWQGHNPEDVWLTVFVFDASSVRDRTNGVDPRPFNFIKVVGARLTKEDWSFSGRSGNSRRTITASVKRSGYDKMEANYIYRDLR